MLQPGAAGQVLRLELLLARDQPQMGVDHLQRPALDVGSTHRAPRGSNCWMRS
jgi:hypothetical protein